MSWDETATCSDVFQTKASIVSDPPLSTVQGLVVWGAALTDPARIAQIQVCDTMGVIYADYTLDKKRLAAHGSFQGSVGPGRIIELRFRSLDGGWTPIRGRLEMWDEIKP